MRARLLRINFVDNSYHGIWGLKQMFEGRVLNHRLLILQHLIVLTYSCSLVSVLKLDSDQLLLAINQKRGLILSLRPLGHPTFIAWLGGNEVIRSSRSRTNDKLLAQGYHNVRDCQLQTANFRLLLAPDGVRTLTFILKAAMMADVPASTESISSHSQL